MIPILECPTAERDALLATGAPVTLLVNPIEFHGPHLSLDNDTLVAAGLARAAHGVLQRAHPDWPYLVMPALRLGVGVVRGPGAQARTYGEVRAAVLESCRSLADLGARRVSLMTFHGNPSHSYALWRGVHWLRSRGVAAVAPFNLVADEVLHLDAERFEGLFDHVADPAWRETVRDGFSVDIHAGFAETSLALHLAPQTVSPSYRELRPCSTVRPSRPLQAASRLLGNFGSTRTAEEFAFAAFGKGWLSLADNGGYTGNPAQATPEAGEWLADFIAERMADCIERVLVSGDDPPPPIMRWLQAVTLNGLFEA